MHANGHVKQASWRGVRSDPRRATYIEGHAWVLIPEVYRLVLVRGPLPLLSPLRLLLLRPTAAARRSRDGGPSGGGGDERPKPEGRRA